MQNKKLPQSSSDPLDQMDDDQAQSRDRVEPDMQDDSHIQKGMANRNFKMWAMMVAAAVVGGVYLYPQDNKPKQAPVVEAAPASRPGLSIVNELAEQAERERNRQPEIPSPPSPLGGLVVDPKIGSMDARSPDTTGENKEATILASSMGGTHVDISGSRGRKKLVDDPDPQPQESTSDKMMREALADAKETMERMTRQEEAAAAAQGVRSAPEHPNKAFQNAASGKGIEPPLGLVAARAPATLYQGTLLRVVLTRSLKSDLPGEVTGRVMSDLYDSVNQETLLIPRGSEVNCSYKSELMVGEELMLMACTRLRLPNGKSFSLAGTSAGDMAGATGIPAEINNHFFKMFFSAAIIGATSLLLPKDQQSITVSNDVSGQSQTGGSIMGTAIHDAVKQVLQRNARIGPTGTVDIGTPFTLTLSRDVELEPYTGRR